MRIVDISKELLKERENSSWRALHSGEQNCKAPTTSAVLYPQYFLVNNSKVISSWSRVILK